MKEKKSYLQIIVLGFIGLLITLLTLSIVALPQTTYAQTYDEYIGLCQPAFGAPSPTSRCLNQNGWNLLSPDQQAEAFAQLQRVIEETEPTRDSLNSPPATEISCAGTWDAIKNPFTCLTRALLITVGAFPAAIGGWALGLSGILFNFLIDITIVDFGYILTEDVQGAINSGWTVFRDIANIVIIGMFTFIAIATILGAQEYGARKMIARVLIVAILINFSLLFTKMIIDASNFTALQFYKIAQTDNPEFTTASPRGAAAGTQLAAEQEGGEAVQAPGIAGRFLLAMGVTTSGDATSVMWNIANRGDGIGVQAMLYGFVLGILFLFAAGVLLYGSFLLFTRMLVFIFLMVTAPVAFASHLIPKLAGLETFSVWSSWWNMLIKNALFAPILMVLLWIALTITEALPRPGTPLGELANVANPPSPLSIAALVSYAIILGLLFMAVRLSSKFSVVGASFGGKLAFTPLVGISRGTGLAFRSTVGAAAVNRAKRIKARTDEEADQADKWSQPYKLRARDRAQMRIGQWFGRRTFDPTNIKQVKQTIERRGGETFGAKWGEKGIIGTRERQAKAALAAAGTMGYATPKETREKALLRKEREQADERRRIAEEEQVSKERIANLEKDRAQRESSREIEMNKGRVVRKEATSDDLKRSKDGHEEDVERLETALGENEVAIRNAADTAHAAEEERLSEERKRLTKELKEAQEKLAGVNHELGEFNKTVRKTVDDDIDQEKKAAEGYLWHLRGRKEALNVEKERFADRMAATTSREAVARQIAAARPGTLFFFGDPDTDPAAERVGQAVRWSAAREQALRVAEAVEERGINLDQGGGGSAGNTSGRISGGGGRNSNTT